MDISSVSGLNSIGSINAIDSQANSASKTNDSSSMFSDILDNLIDNVNSTNSALEGDIVKAAEGELDNPHQLVIDSTKASIALQLLSSVRNDALSAYNDIIKMSI